MMFQDFMELSRFQTTGMERGRLGLCQCFTYKGTDSQLHTITKSTVMRLATCTTPGGATGEQIFSCAIPTEMQKSLDLR